MILVDFSAIMFQSIFGSVQAGNLSLGINNKYNSDEVIPIMRGLLIHSLFEYQKQFKEYGNLILCLDSKNNWRLDILKSYKGTRKSNRAESPFKFDELFTCIDELVEQLDKNTPFSVIKVERAEADDIILTLADKFADTENVMIISSDKDMIQCQKYHTNIHQYSPMKKDFITYEDKSKSMSKWILEHTILGDSADCVPKITDETVFSNEFKNYLISKNIIISPKEWHKMSDIDKNNILNGFTVLDKFGKLKIWYNMKLGPKTLEKIIKEQGLDCFIESNELYKTNLERNKQLVLMEYIPENIKAECINQVNKPKEKYVDNFKKYLIDNGLIQLAETLPANFKLRPLTVQDLLNF